MTERFYHIGIDPGVTGAMAIFDQDAELIEVIDIPVEEISNARRFLKRRICAPKLREIITDYHNSHIYTERIYPRGGRSCVSTEFSIADSAAIIRGVAAGLGLECMEIDPKIWQKHFGLIGKDKEASRFLAIDEVGNEFLKRKMDHNRADAILIGIYGMTFQKLGQPNRNKFFVSPERIAELQIETKCDMTRELDLDLI